MKASKLKKVKKIKNGRMNRNVCITCHQLIPREEREKTYSKDAMKMRRIMKKNNFTQVGLAKAIGISQGTVAGWFIKDENKRGNIKKIYFDILKSKGY